MQSVPRRALSALLIAWAVGVLSKASAEENLYTSKCSPAVSNSFVAEKVRALILHPEAVRDVESARRILGIPLELSSEKKDGITTYVSHSGFSGWCGVVFYKYDGVVNGSFSIFGKYSAQIRIYMDFINGEMKSSDFYSMINVGAINDAIVSHGWESFPRDEWSTEILPPIPRREPLPIVNPEVDRQFKSLAIRNSNGQVQYGILTHSPIFDIENREKYNGRACDRTGLCSFYLNLAAVRQN